MVDYSVYNDQGLILPQEDGLGLMYHRRVSFPSCNECNISFHYVTWYKCSFCGLPFGYFIGSSYGDKYFKIEIDWHLTCDVPSQDTPYLLKYLQQILLHWDGIFAKIYL